MAHERVQVSRVHTEDLLLDIGEDAGALILYADGDLKEREVEVSLVGSSVRTHTQVHERMVNGRTIFAGVYPGLAPGLYRIWSERARPQTRVRIYPGQVAEVDWSSADRDGRAPAMDA